MKRKLLRQDQKSASKTSRVYTSFSLPEFEQFPKIDAFYKNIAQKCRDFSEKSLPALYAEKALFYCVRATSEQADGIIKVKICVTLSDRQAMHLLYSGEQIHVWHQKDQLLIKVKRDCQRNHRPPIWINSIIHRRGDSISSRVIFKQLFLLIHAFSLTRLRRELPPGRSLYSSPYQIWGIH